MMDEYNPDLIHKVLKQLVPNNMNMVLFSQEFAGDVNNVTEKWYGTEYSHTQIEQVIYHFHVCLCLKEKLDRYSLALNRCQADINGHFKLPVKNEFIPSNF